MTSENALDAGTSASDILHKAYIPAMTEVGRLFEVGERFLPEMLIAARAMQAALEILKPQLVDTNVKAVGKVVIGTVAGDLHDIGKNLVAIMLGGAGFEDVDLGTDVKPAECVSTVQKHGPDLVGMSALLTTTMTSMSKTIDALTEAGVRDLVKVIIGGAPVAQACVDCVGADGYAEGAGGASHMAKSLLGLA